MRTVSAAQMREIEKKAILELGILEAVLMENAGRGAAELIHAEFPDAKILIFCGKGNNGGDGFVAARYLDGLGHAVEAALLSAPEKLKNSCLKNFLLLSETAVSVRVLNPDDPSSELSKIIAGYDVVVDAIFGIGLNKPVQGFSRRVVEAINAAHKAVFSLDIPSGLDPDTGSPLGICVSAYSTISFGFPKQGFYRGLGPSLAGKIQVLDIGLSGEV